MSTPRLTATLIVRDEAPVLADCLRSIREVTADILVVDTGSTDGSRAIARSHGARVVEFAWRDDFAAARNEALAHAGGEWILYIDADERARLPSRAGLDRLLADPGVVAGTVRFRPRPGFTRYREYRLFRNDPRIRFQGVIHETMLAGIRQVVAEDGRRIAASDLELDHVGYEGDQRRKHLRNLPLLRVRLVQDPEHVYSWTHLGQTLAGLGDEAGAIAAWRRAIDVVRAEGDHPAAHSLPYVEMLRRSPSLPDATEILDEAVRLFPGDSWLAWAQGRRLLGAGRFAEAIPLFARLAEIDGETFCHDRVAYDVRIFGARAYDCLALCHFRLGRYVESARYYALAETSGPADPAYAVRRRLAEARARRRSAGRRRPVA